MSDDKFDVVFKGDLVRTLDSSAVKQNVGKLFKIDGAKLDSLFSGKFVVLKRNLDFDTAMKYRVAIKRAGALVDLVPVEPKVEAKREEVVPKPPSEQRPMAALDQKEPASGGQGYAMTVAPVGADVLSSSERPAPVEMEIDVSALSLKPNQGDLLDATEKKVFEPLALNLDDFDLADVGETLLRQEERTVVAVPQIDTSQMSVSAPGERLSEPTPEPPPPPDVSRINLAPNKPF